MAQIITKKSSHNCDEKNVIIYIITKKPSHQARGVQIKLSASHKPTLASTQTHHGPH
jgi:hypothetical protein